jgi:hypothetical protein
MEYQTRMVTGVQQWAARLNAHVQGVSHSRPVVGAQY